MKSQKINRHVLEFYRFIALRNEQKQDLAGPGIYAIVNILNGHKYIGQSIDVGSRWEQHKAVLNSGKHGNIHLQNAWKRYGKTSFKFVLVEMCGRGELDDREQYWIEKARPEYNIMLNVFETPRGYAIKNKHPLSKITVPKQPGKPGRGRDAKKPDFSVDDPRKGKARSKLWAAYRKAGSWHRLEKQLGINWGYIYAFVVHGTIPTSPAARKVLGIKEKRPPRARKWKPNLWYWEHQLRWTRPGDYEP